MEQSLLQTDKVVLPDAGDAARWADGRRAGPHTL